MYTWTFSANENNIQTIAQALRQLGAQFDPDDQLIELQEEQETYVTGEQGAEIIRAIADQLQKCKVSTPDPLPLWKDLTTRRRQELLLTALESDSWTRSHTFDFEDEDAEILLEYYLPLLRPAD